MAGCRATTRNVKSLIMTIVCRPAAMTFCLSTPFVVLLDALIRTWLVNEKSYSQIKEEKANGEWLVRTQGAAARLRSPSAE